MKTPLTIRHENQIYDAEGKRIVILNESDLDFLFEDDERHAQEFIAAVNAMARLKPLLERIALAHMHDPGETDLDDEQPVNLRLSLGDVRLVRDYVPYEVWGFDSKRMVSAARRATEDTQRLDNPAASFAS